MAALREVHTHHGVTHIQQCKVHGQVGLCAGMRLHVCIFGAEQLAGAVNGQLLNLVYISATAVIAMARIALCVLVGEHRAHCGHYGRADNVFTCNQLNVAALAGQLPVHCGSQLFILSGNAANVVHHILIHGVFPPWPVT